MPQGKLILIDAERITGKVEIIDTGDIIEVIDPSMSIKDIRMNDGVLFLEIFTAADIKVGIELQKIEPHG